MIVTTIVMLLASVAYAIIIVVLATRRRRHRPKDHDVAPSCRQATALYVYGYPAVLMHVTMTNSLAQTHTGTNRFYHVRTFPTSDFRSVVSPNVDTLYSSAWLDLHEPLQLDLPTIRDGRYYVVEFVDAWSNVFADPGTRLNGGHSQRIVITGPAALNQSLPNDNDSGNTLHIQSPTAIAWVIVRIQCNGTADYDAVHTLQDLFKLTAGSTGQGRTGGSSVLPWSTALPPPLVVQRMTTREFFSTLAKLQPLAPRDEHKQHLLTCLGRASCGDLAAVATMGTDIIQKAALGKLIGAWQILGPNTGDFGDHYLERARVAMVLLAANRPDDAVYMFANTDTRGHVLHSRSAYDISFSSIPPVRAFWSLTLYNDQHFLVSNRINRYAIQSWQPLLTQRDGSFSVRVQQFHHDASSANWLPSPQGGEPFNLILRMYWPMEGVLAGNWQPPVITRL